MCEEKMRSCFRLRYALMSLGTHVGQVVLFYKSVLAAAVAFSLRWTLNDGWDRL